MTMALHNQAFADAMPVRGRWSWRRTFALVTTLSAALWVLIALAIHAFAG